jgi:hypothetical protein
MRESLHYNHYIYDPPFTTAFAFFWFRMVLLLVLQFFRLSIVFSTEEEQNRTRGAETGGGGGGDGIATDLLQGIFCWGPGPLFILILGLHVIS